MDASTSSQGSYVLINHHNHSTQLHPYFPLLAQPARFTSHQQQLEQVQQLRQQQPDKQLFIDHLLKLAAPPGSVSYPPTSHSDLSSLISTLSTSPLNPLTARSCLYYLALTFSSPALAASYAEDHLLPTAFRLSVRAFHALDNGNYSLGLKLLSDPRVTPDFIPRTFALLDSLPEPKERAQLVLSYWRLAGIKLEEQTKEEVKVVVRALCAEGRKHGANEAWLLAREWHVESEREELAKTVLAVCFGHNPTRLPLAQHLSTLLARPFTSAEDALSTSFCASPPSFLNPTLTADWRLSKLIAESRPVDALRFWATVKRNGNNRVEPSDQRDRLLAAVEANLTSIQKTTLSLEIASAPAPSTTTTSSTQPAANITQPAWAPLPPTASSSSVPVPPAVAPPRTLAAARLAQLPPPPPPQPRAEDLPLSASPFVRSGPAAAGGASGVLKALDAATPRKASQPGFVTGVTGFAASPATRINGSPFAFPPPSTAGSTVGGAPSTIGTGGGAGSVVELPASPTKPTLAGFGSVRQLPPPPSPAQQATPKAPVRRETSSRRFIPQQQPQEDEAEDEDGDAAMAVDDEQPSRQQQQPQQAEDEEEDNEEEEQDYAFAARAALDPAIAATIAAAEKKPAPPAPTSSSKTPSKRVAGAASARSTRTRERGDKRRAVSAEPEEKGGKGKGKTPARGNGNGNGGRTSGRRATTANSSLGREKPDEGKTVKLPPGAFPGEEEEEEDEEQEEEPSPPPTTTRRSSRASQAQSQQKTPARRSTRTGSRQSTVDPPSPAESTTSNATATALRGARTTRRSTRASSLAPSEAGEEEDGEDREEGEKPKRRSSRLSSAGGGEGGKGGRRTTRSAAGGRRTGRIEEEE